MNELPTGRRPADKTEIDWIEELIEVIDSLIACCHSPSKRDIYRFIVAQVVSDSAKEHLPGLRARRE